MQHLFEQVSTAPQLHHATPTLVLQCAFVMMILIYIYYSPPPSVLSLLLVLLSPHLGLRIMDSRR